jgi:hypothetical protein
MFHARADSQLPLYSSTASSSSSSSFSSPDHSEKSKESHATQKGKGRWRHLKSDYSEHELTSIQSATSRSCSEKLETAVALFPAGLSAIHSLILGRRRPLPVLLFCFLSLFILASLTTSEEYIPSSVSNSRAKLTSIFTSGFRTSIRLPTAPPSSDITLDDDRPRNWQSPTPPLPIDATLTERLQALWDSPLEEPANWVKWNSQTCSRERVKQAQNDWITQDAALIWHSLNSTDVKRYRKGMIDYLVECEKQGLMDPNNVGEGRG